MRILIVDDERVARHKVRTALEGLGGIDDIAECADGAEAVEQITAHPPDLVFLDVQLPELNGFEVIRAVGTDRMPAIVFVTAFDQYAIQAFDVEALDYVVKPFDDERLRVAFDRARRRVGPDAAAGLRQRLETLLERVESHRPIERLVVRVDERSVVLPVTQVDWIEAADNYVRLYVGPRYHLVRGKISALEARLDPRRFVRVHRSAIVNVERVTEIRPGLRGESVVLRDGRAIPIGPTRREALLERLGIQL